jgi:hypothetical protein
MALSNYTYFEVRTTGSDTTNSGGFDVSSLGFSTDGSITNANTSSPIISSASYTFVAGDVGSWVFIKSGTNSIPGWYKIVSVNTGAATLIGTIGQAFRIYNDSGYLGGPHPSIDLGCGTAATLSSITFGVDYSQQDSYEYTGTFVVQANTTDIIGSGITINKNWVGNLINLTSTAPGSATVGYYSIMSVTGNTARLDRSAGTAASTSVGYVGGALASPGMAAGLSVLGNKIYIKNGLYIFNSETANVSNGIIQTKGGRLGTAFYGHQLFEGYSVIRGDKVNPPTLKAGDGITSSNIYLFDIRDHVNRFENLIIDGSNKPNIYGIRDTQQTVGNFISRCEIINCYIGFQALTGTASEIFLCKFSGHSNNAINIQGGNFKIVNCSFYNNTFTPVYMISGTLLNCIIANNTGATTDGIYTYLNDAIINCTIYNNGRHGVFWENNGGTFAHTFINNIIANNGGFGLFSNVAPNFSNTVEHNTFFNNASGNINRITGTNLSNNLILSTTPFVDAANGNFALNTLASGGALVRRSGSPRIFPGFINTISYTDPGAVQNIDAPTAYINPEISILIRAGTTSKTEFLYLSTTGMAFNSVGLSASYVRPGSARVGITLVTQTVSGSWTSGGFVEVDSVNMPGIYRFDIPNAVFASGVNSAAIEIFNSNTNDRFVITYHFTQEMQLDLTQSIPNSTITGSIGEALNAMRAQGFGKWTFDGTNLSMYAADNVTILKTLSFNSVSNPTMRS